MKPAGDGTSAVEGLLLNPLAERRPYGPEERAVVDHRGHAAALAEIGSWPGYAPTPLLDLPGLAARLGLGRILFKDEGRRFGLGSFKALGGAYGVLEVLRRALAPGVRPAPSGRELLTSPLHEAASGLTVTCATDGNHGKAVAWGARTFGCRCVVYVAGHVSETRVGAIEELGARVVRTEGDYDSAVRRAQADADLHGWHVVSDTSYEGYDIVPRAVMQGYTVLAGEVVDAIHGEWPTHLFLQGGVGGFAAAVAGHFWEARGSDRPTVVVVEPVEANGLYVSARAGEPRRATGSLQTVMGCLSCGEISAVAWAVLRPGVDAFLTIPDSFAREAVRTLALGVGGDPTVAVGESGAAGLGGLLAAVTDPGVAGALGLDGSARVLLVGTEGPNDPDVWAGIVGHRPPS